MRGRERAGNHHPVRERERERRERERGGDHLAVTSNNYNNNNIVTQLTALYYNNYISQLQQ